MYYWKKKKEEEEGSIIEVFPICNLSPLISGENADADADIAIISNIHMCICKVWLSLLDIRIWIMWFLSAFAHLLNAAIIIYLHMR